MSILLEQEIKFRLSSLDDGEARIHHAGAVLVKARHFETNCLYDFPDARLEKRGSALRIRSVGDEAWLTFKGPQHGSGRIKQRKELETFLGDGIALEAILDALGLEERFRYEKYRAIYELGEAEVALDETPIGPFLEIEGDAERIAEATSRLSLELDDAIHSTYIRLYELHRQETPGAPPGRMVFGGAGSPVP